MAKDKVIGVDLGGTNLRVALIKGNRILKYVKKKTPSEAEELKSLLFQTIEEVMTPEVRAIGVASPGPLKHGIIRNPPNLPLRNYNLKGDLEKRFKLRVEVKNDANCVSYAEAKIGCRKKNFFILTLGTGIGGGIIINGELYRGGGYAGELGHIVLDNGNYFESLAASKRLKVVTKKAFGRELLIKDLLKMKDQKAVKILDELVRYLGQGIASLINVFDPEIVILAGGVREAGQGFLNRIKKEAHKYSTLPKKTPITWSTLAHPGVLGASLFVR